MKIIKKRFLDIGMVIVTLDEPICIKNTMSVFVDQNNEEWSTLLLEGNETKIRSFNKISEYDFKDPTTLKEISVQYLSENNGILHLRNISLQTD